MGINRSTMTTQVYQSIKHMIISGELKQDEKLTEQGVARDLDVSPTPVREAFNRLTSEGFLIAKPYQGVRVRTYSKNDVREAYLIRAKLQGLVYQIFLEKMNSEMEDELKSSYLEAMESDETNVFLRFHDFHTRVFELADCPIIQENIVTINAIISIDILSKITGEFDEERHSSYHQALMEAIHKKDSLKAVSIVEAIVIQTMDFVLENIK